MHFLMHCDVMFLCAYLHIFSVLLVLKWFDASVLISLKIRLAIGLYATTIKLNLTGVLSKDDILKLIVMLFNYCSCIQCNIWHGSLFLVL